jgi:hypothetical protein
MYPAGHPRLCDRDRVIYSGESQSSELRLPNLLLYFDLWRASSDLWRAIDNGDFLVRGNQRTLIAVVLNNANCTVLTVQITLAKLRLVKLHLNPNKFRLRHDDYEFVIAIFCGILGY